ncbi:hypothetical protein ACRCPS_18000 [Pseudomonas aeruginosa]
MRIAADEALRLKIIDKDAAAEMKGGKRSGLKLGAAVAKLNPQIAAELARTPALAKPAGNKRPSSAPSSGSKEYLESDRSPQRLLFNALCERLPGVPVWEAQGLIPGRKYRTDIFIPPRVVIEMDGYAFHRDLESFKKDRQKQNLYVANGFLPIRAFASQIFDAKELAELVELIVRTTELSVTPAPATDAP